MGIGIPESGTSGLGNKPKGSKSELEVEVGLRRGDMNSAGIHVPGGWSRIDEAADVIALVVVRVEWLMSVRSK